ncbi:hypothetical protein KY084_04020 [Stakelama sp. CBK3Z-3]|uniref:Uncharacterized protein n=1 Tax=Stakelama flava TaxID=2860338 RepID=A0ABS6XIK3_9SPHN|nr:hypothetical protein [Stakelama flava]MBW4330039.1 hypothetical protein [Stakelama flava]
MAELTDDEKESRRRAALAAQEEEAWYAEDEYRQRQAEEEEASNREDAIESMVTWFEEQFEDPQNETPFDSEDGEYVYVFGGPFDAGEVLGDQFSSDYKQEWIEAAVEQLQATGIFEWAPRTGSDYYEHPERDEEHANPSDFSKEEISSRILQRLDDLEARLADLPSAPASIGHNSPPDDVGLPPYDNESRQELEVAIRQTRAEVGKTEPSEPVLAEAESAFRRVGTAIAKWIGAKLDLAVDETIKATVRATAWGTVAAFALGIADDLAALIRHLFSF